MDLELHRPDLLDGNGWAAIEQQRTGLETAVKLDDAPLVIGSAKELVESVARVATAAMGSVTPSDADSDKVVNDAHVAVRRQAGQGLSGAQDVRAIADHAKKLVLKVRGVRNDYGTGHGHAEVRSIADEMVSLTVSASMLWERWALVRVEHLLRREPEGLISELRGHATRRSL